MFSLRYNSLREEKKKREKEEARQRKEDEEKAARQAQEAAEVARKAQEAEEAARQKREAAEAARRAQEEVKRQKDAEEAAKREKEVEEEARKLSEQKAKKEAVELLLKLEIHGQNDARDLAPKSKEKESQQAEAGPRREAEVQDGRMSHEHKSFVILEKHNEERADVQKANKDSKIALPAESSGNTASANSTALSKTSPHVSAEEDVKSSQTGSPTTNTIHPDASRPKAPPMGKLPTSRSQEKRELRRQRGLEHSQRESVRAAAAGKDESCKELDHYTFISHKSEKPKKEAKDEEEKVKKEATTCPARPSTLPLEVPASNEPKHAPETKDIPSRGKSNTQPEITLKEPKHQEDKRTRMLKYGFFLCLY